MSNPNRDPRRNDDEYNRDQRNGSGGSKVVPVILGLLGFFGILGLLNYCSPKNAQVDTSKPAITSPAGPSTAPTVAPGISTPPPLDGATVEPTPGNASPEPSTSGTTVEAVPSPEVTPSPEVSVSPSPEVIPSPVVTPSPEVSTSPSTEATVPGNGPLTFDGTLKRSDFPTNKDYYSALAEKFSKDVVTTEEWLKNPKLTPEVTAKYNSMLEKYKANVEKYNKLKVEAVNP
jgi:hypothetical protein